MNRVYLRCFSCSSCLLAPVVAYHLRCSIPHKYLIVSMNNKQKLKLQRGQMNINYFQNINGSFDFPAVMLD